jgi:hypothetical protein
MLIANEAEGYDFAQNWSTHGIEHTEPLFKLDDDAEIINRIRANRKYLKEMDWTSQIITYPDISLSKYDESRLKFIKPDKPEQKGYYIRMVNRLKQYEKYLTRVKDMIKKRYSIIITSLSEY